MAELTEWKVEGMTCSNCALSIANFLKKAGLQDIKVNPIDGQLLFLNDKKIGEDKLIAGIKGLGYQVVNSEALTPGKKRILADNRSRFLFCLPFTAVLMLHLLDKWIPLHWLMDPWLQMGLSLPVFILGMLYFGKSAINSLLNGMPNMNVLVALGALAAFAYSFYGVFILGDHNYMFFETSSSIITLVFLGNFLEERSIQSTQKAIQSLARSQKVMANMIAFDDQHKEIIFQVENSVLKTGDLLQINSGEQVPMDCKILWGECMVNEAIISGESKPLLKQKKEGLIGGSILESGSVKAQVTATGKDTVMAGILRMVRRAQGEKPPVQKMADRISAVFVPVVIGIAILTFLINYFGFAISTSMSLMRSIAVLVISCPCAMGLATQQPSLWDWEGVPKTGSCLKTLPHWKPLRISNRLCLTRLAP